jgi:hypothetical protein
MRPGQYTVHSRRVRECGICHRILAMLALVDAVSNNGECEAPPVWRMKPAPTRAVHQSCQSGDSARGLCRNKKWDVVTFDMESTLCGRVRIWRTGVRSGTIDGHGFATTSQNWPPVRCCAGWKRPWLAGQGELGVAASSRVPETVELATSEQRTRPPAALGLVRLPVSVRAARQMSPPRANVA